MTTRSTTRGFGVSSLVPHDIVRQLAPAAEAGGYAMFWVNDLPGSSGISSLGIAGEAAPTIELGVGVLAVDRWDARRVAEAIDEAGVEPDRLTIGIGAGQLTVGSQAAVREAAHALSEIGARRVIVGSLGPKLTRIGGVDADGVLLNWVTPVAAETLAAVATSGADSADSSAWLSGYTRVASDEAARDRLLTECRAYEGYPAYARHFERFGVSAMETSVLGDRPAVDAWLNGFDGVLDHVVARAIAATESLDAYLDVLHAAAPARDGPTS